MRFAALAALVLIALPAAAQGATVRVDEKPDFVNEARLTYAAAPGEENSVVIAIAGEEGDYLRLAVRDTGAAIEAGERCSGGGAAGEIVTCMLQKPRASKLKVIGGKVAITEAGTGWEDGFTVYLGDGNNSFDAGGFPGEAPYDRVDMDVYAGDGADRITTGNGADRIDPGYGPDAVHAGGGYNQVFATPVADGPDLYDLTASAMSKLSYERRTEPVSLAGTTAGGAGEGDTVLAQNLYVVGGAAGDSFAGGPGHDRFEGNAGEDALDGGPGADELFGGQDNDALHGGAKHDNLSGGPGDDLLDGGKGADRIIDRLLPSDSEPGTYVPIPQPPGTSGDDVALGGAGDDTISLEAGSDRANGGPGKDRIGGGDGGDRLAGGAGDDTVVGQFGFDRLDGGRGRDRLFGGRTPKGPTFYFMEADDDGRDALDCGAGRDVASANPWDATRACEAVRIVPSIGAPLIEADGR